ncbi:MAG: 2-oxoacid:acceptor oxidoreductase subunit alpha [Aminobacterium sp.]|jgi:2-oxoglutarate ferredoxin oxidoreductase subunit alpha|uniref:2-oxoacid:acceptor oxidoreductase subunit alpha n=1 Tax=Aminobacterium sp. MB27-C1 TaxID=3070661 RepID=UPI001BCEBA9A|nr:2-oxoacid:acceptor oxidoreductase subunit alpha [Aminobacterium sp. MB27-C1]MDD2206203.1 2-oxoacid:acceptor oxidoreductase subunit alpha [Aminobacterium sp.]MDD3425823.1 2-oxoacid:acceptor oxidoreductase subunit alpha [Aminobacterium sp.]MDD3707641.1 2-oxoacid:acceptor oxidoreductase subunit alpha [Aminobacterium sp.]MDD4227953.1 2-oxoacid:acceptor oxidoreductase subunit alpha [Aminobacterium sp.]MDD4551200.1 2-oxoacid:acceptor oxidoreductase subunit alpha [Aminobacterium sp.]
MTIPIGKSRKEISLVLCGAAGQGVQTVEELLIRAIRHIGYSVFASREYMSRVRGGNNSTEIRISPWPIRAFVDRIDIAVPLSLGVRDNILRRISKETIVICDQEDLGSEIEKFRGSILNVNINEVAREIGGKVFSNFIAAGVILGLIGGGMESAKAFCDEKFSGKKEKLAEQNKVALERGYVIGRSYIGDDSILLPPDQAIRSAQRVVMSGTEAVSLGALSAGCSFVTAYPMSPATGVLTFMAQKAKEMEIIVEQAEDEIAAINMAIGASYSGARSMVTTSGGGFDLMCEGVSLAGVMETPVVIHLAQRPGPATGMATRTEQGDLNVALYGGHGEFPRAVLAPASLEEAFRLSSKAFYLADTYQIPVILMTDQYFLNTYYDMAMPDVKGTLVPPAIVEANDNYRRYEITHDGISPRAVPGYGNGLVGADSHEHDEIGHVYEDFDLRERMVQKRLRKIESMQKDIEEPLLIGPEDFRTLIIGWGSSFHIIEETLEFIGRSDTALMHFQQIYPLPQNIGMKLEQAQKIIVIEGNKTGQFARLLTQHTGRMIDYVLPYYSGLQFSVEQLTRDLDSCLNGEVL